MILQVEKKELSPGVMLLSLKGRLMMGNDSRQVEWAITELVQEGKTRIILDLTPLDAIDSTGVGIIVMCNAKLQKAGGEMRIVSTDGIVESTLLLTHVDRIVKFFETPEAAAQGFKG